MHIGITYDLRSEYLAAGYSEDDTAEFDHSDTIDGIASALAELGHRVDRIGNARQLIARLAKGDTWDLVFNICEGLYGLGREAQVPAILDVFRIPYTFGDPLVMSLCLHKGIAKTVVARGGLPTSRYLVVDRLSDLADLRLRYPLFAKPVAEGTGKGISAESCIFRRPDLLQACQRLLDRYRQPVLVEEFLSGREFTVGLLGTGHTAEVLGTMEVTLGPGAEPNAYSYKNKEQSENLVHYRLVRPEDDAEVESAEQIALDAWKLLGGRDAGRIDLRSDARGRPHFLEANPLAGLHPSHSDLPMLATLKGMSYLELISRIVESATQRISPA
jgi:D-alanine-D-alanine ligase